LRIDAYFFFDDLIVIAPDEQSAKIAIKTLEKSCLRLKMIVNKNKCGLLLLEQYREG
jgi:hypothetical protein